MSEVDKVSGLRTVDALQLLHTELVKVVDDHTETLKKVQWRHFLSAMRGKSSCFSPFSLVCFLVMSVLLFVAAFVDSDGRSSSGTKAWLIFEAFFLLISAALNCVLLYFQIRRRFNKHTDLKMKFLETLNAAASDNKWNERSYPMLHTPISPCISLQWVIRDGHLVNLPHPLLVEGDLIVMRPGLAAPGNCKSVEDDSSLLHGEVYCGSSSQAKGDGPQPRVPLSAKKFVLQETPILKNFRLTVEDKMEKPRSLLENERYTITSVYLEFRLLPAVFILSMAINVVRFLYLDREEGHWGELLIALQVHGLLPIIPIFMPGLWSLVNTFGQECIFEAYNSFGSSQDFKESTESIGSCSTISVDDRVPKIQWRRLLRSMWASFSGVKGSACPDFEMLHALGSVTAMCCVDKKGILSWPNPSAEKVLFFSTAMKPRPEEEEDNIDLCKEEKRPERRKKRSRQESDPDTRYSIEVLDVTPDSAKDAFSLLFDDPRWKDHIAALKPLGLDILLNTCNENTSEWYTQFTDHVACAARENKETVAVVGRRCLCSLSKEMGFTDDAVNIFSQEATLGAYRQVPAEEAEREKQNRARSFIQHKIPMPNQVSVVARDKLTGLGQLMTQGTGDLVLDCCTDAWTGADLHMLSELDRKRVLDFYHRNSMVAYCTAFAYKPLPRTILDWPEHVYTELVESPSVTKVVHGEDVGVFLDGDEGETLQRQRSHSVDSLLELSPASSVEELRMGQMLQSHQTFLGMISLQYQARQDFVQLISKLESACIKFVHFSKENEVRSRVFAEKMGLEAGWNCHVSLMAVASEPVSSANSSSRNLSSLGQHPTLAATGDGEISADAPGSGGAGGGSGLGSSAVPAQPADPSVMTLSAGSPMSMPRVHSAPSVVNIEGAQVKFAKNPLPIVYDHESATENSLLLGDTDRDSSATQANADSGLEPTSSELTSQRSDLETAHDSNHVLSTENSSSAVESSETAALLRRSSLSASSKKRQQHPSGESDKCVQVSSAPKAEGEVSSADEDSDDEDEEEEFDVHSDSRCTSSYVTENTEDSLTGAFDNRAHLPRGIENIRPHLKNVDNVPLLVNLFTDCVPEATQEMIKIMQENGEIVLVVGSSLNMDNTSIFMQGDCSIAIEPMYPQLCARRPVLVQPWTKEDLHPTQLASRALSLPCPLFFQRHDNIKLIELIMESRHFILALRNSFYLMLCCSLMLVLSQLLCCLLLLPPPLAVQHVLWLVCVLVPALSLSLLGNPNEARSLNMATHKNINLVNKQMVFEFLKQFTCRFVPSILMTLISFGLVLNSFCSRPGHECSLYSSRITGSGNSKDDTAWTHKFQGGLVLAQNIFHLYLTIFMVAVSVSLVHWQDHLWQKLPFKNLVWSVTAAAIIFLQLVFTVFDMWARHSLWGDTLPLADVHPAVWVIGCVWPFVVISLNELSKRREIKLALRAQKRARLDFDTKLGMNSPF
ncbi:hypothetical protein RRG08_039160 [Elysia crispata]|uniref:Transmembrane protein 94 n=1 Tax=Elysia crispata TaxID=231223 RepID=A0AAE0ZDC4_9GAST|nr:hypothetical protein RRG08_039160 [Elysia crispata]